MSYIVGNTLPSQLNMFSFLLKMLYFKLSSNKMQLKYYKIEAWSQDLITS